MMLFFLMLACRQEPHPDDSPTDSDTDLWDTGEEDSLPEGIYEIDGLDATLPPNDLDALVDIVGDASVVALGESVHTSGGYYQAKYRLFRYLVEQQGFRVFAFESPWTDAELIADYVSTGEGSAFTAVTSGLFGVWADENVLDLVEWMRTYNEEHPGDPVSFYGFDIQQPWDDGAALTAFLESTLAQQATSLIDGFASCNGATYQSAEDYYADPDAMVVSEDDHLACNAGLDAVKKAFVDYEDEIIDALSEEALAWAKIYLVGLRSWEGEVYYYDSDPTASYQSRDEGMVEVFQSIRQLRHRDERVVIWAHNWHISANSHLSDSYPSAAKSMGTFLNEQMGVDYVPIGLGGYAVSINWPGIYTGEIVAPAHRDVLTKLHALERDYLLVDFTFPGAEDPFLKPGKRYLLCAEEQVPAEQFRAFLFLDESPMMESLLW
ncbi:MAG: erythromycin esterase family protein [Proteobacteria bacterium]|jgi:erythromycin esterase|nr:erythromycin esterase family protein [Pseudomonadota bacterium]